MGNSAEIQPGPRVATSPRKPTAAAAQHCGIRNATRLSSQPKQRYDQHQGWVSATKGPVLLLVDQSSGPIEKAEQRLACDSLIIHFFLSGHVALIAIICWGLIIHLTRTWGAFGNDEGEGEDNAARYPDSDRVR